MFELIALSTLGLLSVGLFYWAANTYLDTSRELEEKEEYEASRVLWMQTKDKV